MFMLTLNMPPKVILLSKLLITIQTVQLPLTMNIRDMTTQTISPLESLVTFVTCKFINNSKAFLKISVHFKVKVFLTFVASHVVFQRKLLTTFTN